MPFESKKQRRMIYARAAEGEEWARRFIRHSGETPPPLRGRKKRRK